MVRENHIEVADLIYPIFVVEGKGINEEIVSMPDIFRYSPDNLPAIVEEVAKLEIPAIILFGIPENKDETGSLGYDPNGVIQQAVRVIKKEVPELVVITDVCLCGYTSHGHCGVVNHQQVDNDQTLPLLAQIALSHAEAGADMVAPSDMMDGRVKTIRESLDGKGFTYIPIMSYAAKYSSAYYGPFRDAVESAPQFGDRRAYQMDPANSREALREVEQDIAEGADIVMVKPALAYMDIIRQVRDNYNLPLAAYNVSGEYSMVKAAALKGWIDEKRVVMETLTAMKRAGADIILTYHAKDVAAWLK
jgi:porphobilinogen synthase